jgi:beta-galactosidase
VRYFVTAWRRSPITTDRPDPNQQVAEQDMNSWERITPGPAAANANGYAIYRATIKPPKIVQSHGGRIAFHSLGGNVEIYVNGSRVDNPQAVAIPPATTSAVISVLVAGPGGLAGPVEIVCANL